MSRSGLDQVKYGCAQKPKSQMISLLIDEDDVTRVNALTQ